MEKFVVVGIEVESLVSAELRFFLSLMSVFFLYEVIPIILSLIQCHQIYED